MEKSSAESLTAILIGYERHTMKNKSLAQDYFLRAKVRLKAVNLLLEHDAYADTVRESQEVVELALKALLRFAHIEVPRVHDVGDILLEQKQSLPPSVSHELEKMAEISRSLRRDRELAFYGSEDLTPSQFYKKKDAKEAFKQAEWVVTTLSKVFQD